MSTELPFVEAQLDALTNTIWWTLDQKFGRVTRPLSPPTILSRLQQIWDSLFYRLSIATVVPYLLSLFDKCHRPGRMAVWLWGLCILGPWVYQIFVYSWFIDPLRRLPGPKVSSQSEQVVNSRDIGFLVWISEFLTKTYFPRSSSHPPSTAPFHRTGYS